MISVEIDNKISKIIVEISGTVCDIQKIQNKSLMSGEVGLSPIDLLDIFFKIEKEFNIKFDRQDILNCRFDNLMDIRKLILKKLRNDM